MSTLNRTLFSILKLVICPEDLEETRGEELGYKREKSVEFRRAPEVSLNGDTLTLTLPLSHSPVSLADMFGNRIFSTTTVLPGQPRITESRTLVRRQII